MLLLYPQPVTTRGRFLGCAGWKMIIFPSCFPSAAHVLNQQCVFCVCARNSVNPHFCPAPVMEGGSSTTRLTRGRWGFRPPGFCVNATLPQTAADANARSLQAFSRQPNKLRPLTLLALVVGSRPLASFSPTRLHPIMPRPNTGDGFFLEEGGSILQEASCVFLIVSMPTIISCSWLMVLVSLQSARFISSQTHRRRRRNVLNVCVHLSDATF